MIMTSTIQLNNELRLKAVEINDKIINALLSLKTNRIFF